MNKKEAAVRAIVNHIQMVIKALLEAVAAVVAIMTIKEDHTNNKAQDHMTGQVIQTKEIKEIKTVKKIKEIVGQINRIFYLKMFSLSFN